MIKVSKKESCYPLTFKPNVNQYMPKNKVVVGLLGISLHSSEDLAEKNNNTCQRRFIRCKTFLLRATGLNISRKYWQKLENKRFFF